MQEFSPKRASLKWHGIRGEEENRIITICFPLPSPLLLSPFSFWGNSLSLYRGERMKNSVSTRKLKYSFGSVANHDSRSLIQKISTCSILNPWRFCTKKIFYFIWCSIIWPTLYDPGATNLIQCLPLSPYPPAWAIPVIECPPPIPPSPQGLITPPQRRRLFALPDSAGYTHIKAKGGRGLEGKISLLRPMYFTEPSMQEFQWYFCFLDSRFF